MAAVTLWLARRTHRWMEVPFMRRKTRVPVLVAGVGTPAPVAFVIPSAALPAEARLHHAPRAPATI